MAGTLRYRELLGVRRFPSLLAASLLGRMNLGMVGLAAVLLTAQVTGSYAGAGVVAASYGLASAVAAPVWGRVVDRRGQRSVLAVSTALYAGVLLTAAASAAQLGLAGLAALALLAGSTSPPLLGAVRATWPRLLGRGPRLEAAYALEATTQELTFIAGPAIVGLLAAAFNPQVAMVATALVTALGIGAYLAVLPPALAAPSRHGEVPGRTGADRPDTDEPAATGRSGAAAPRAGWTRVLRAPGFVVLVVVAALLSAHFSAVELATVAFAGEHGSASHAGLLLAVWSVGSMAGGLSYGALRLHSRLATRLAVLLAGCAAAISLLVFARSLTAVALVLFLAGLSIAPGISCVYALVERLAPAHGLSEAFQWLSTGFSLGGAPGAAVSGALVQRLSPAAGFAVGALCVAAAAAVTAAFRARLSPATTPVVRAAPVTGQAG